MISQRRGQYPGAPTYYSAKISGKIHENEENWTGEGGRASKFYHVDLPL